VSEPKIEPERAEKLCEQIMDALHEFADEHYVNRIPALIADGEAPMALVQAIGHVVAAIECPDCRKKKVEATRGYLTDVLGAVNKAAPPGSNACALPHCLH
jgi:hypothetical protein